MHPPQHSQACRNKPLFTPLVVVGLVCHWFVVGLFWFLGCWFALVVVCVVVCVFVGCWFCHCCVLVVSGCCWFGLLVCFVVCVVVCVFVC